MIYDAYFVLVHVWLDIFSLKGKIGSSHIKPSLANELVLIVGRKLTLEGR